MESELKKRIKNLNELEKSLRFKKFDGNIDSVDYEDLDNYDYNYDFADDDEYRKIESIRTQFKELIGIIVNQEELILVLQEEMIIT